MSGITTQIWHALRRLSRTPAFTLPTILTLGLAIAGNAAIFAVVHGVVLNPLPYPDSDGLLQLEHGSARVNLASGIGMTSGLYYQYLRARTLDAVAIYRVGESTVIGRGEPVRVPSAETTATLARTLRVAPELGRWFSEQEMQPGATQVVVLSHGLWVRRYGADPHVIGRAIGVDGAPAQVIGVMPAAFAFPDARTEIWVPTQISRATGFGLPFRYVGVARLRDGATLAGARSELNALIADLPQAYPGDRGVIGNVGQRGLRSVPIPLKDATIGAVASALWILFAAMGLVLVIACVNVANLFIVRSETRQREMAVRRALGAGAAGIARVFLVESGLLSATGGIVGLSLAWVAIRLLVANGPPTLPRLQEVRLDIAGVIFTFGLATMAALTFGIMPLFRRGPLADSLRESGRGNTATRQRHRCRQLLMAGQVAMSLVLLVAAALMLESFEHLRAFDPGFDPRATVTFRVGLPERNYPTRDGVVAVHRALLDRLSHIPGVTAVSASTGLPLADACFGNSVLVEGQILDESSTSPVARLCAVSGEYVEAMHMRLARGRALTSDDIDHRRSNVMVNEAFAARVFPGEDPIGKRIRSNAPPPPSASRDASGLATWNGAPPWLTIVGVVANTPFTRLGEATPAAIVYMPMSIAGGPDVPARAMLGPSVLAMSYVIRSTVPVSALMPSIRRAVDAVDSTLAIAQVQTLQEILHRGSAQMAFTMVLLSIAAALALVMGLIGIYGVVSYIVGQRRNEIGVRLALGATPTAVVNLIVRQGTLVALGGIGVGVVAALAGGRFIESLLYQVSARDPEVFAVGTLALLAVAILACWIPARHAAAVSPVEALRAE